jgi:hypothetical protein
LLACMQSGGACCWLRGTASCRGWRRPTAVLLLLLLQVAGQPGLTAQEGTVACAAVQHLPRLWWAG